MKARSTHKGAAIAVDTVVPPDHMVAATAKHSVKEPAIVLEPSKIEERCGLSIQTLLRTAHRSGIADPVGCATTLALLSASHTVRTSVRLILKPYGLSKARFRTLVIIYSLDPTPSTSADLADQVETTRAAMAATLDQMRRKRWIHRKPVTADRRVIHIHLTDKGREVAVLSIYRFLEAAGEMAGKLTATQHRSFRNVCSRLQQHARAIT